MGNFHSNVKETLYKATFRKWSAELAKEVSDEILNVPYWDLFFEIATLGAESDMNPDIDFLITYCETIPIFDALLKTIALCWVCDENQCINRLLEIHHPPSSREIEKTKFAGWMIYVIRKISSTHNHSDEYTRHSLPLLYEKLGHVSLQSFDSVSLESGSFINEGITKTNDLRRVETNTELKRVAKLLMVDHIHTEAMRIESQYSPSIQDI